ncbi:MAG: serine hydrolase [Candidatus Limnocylindrales bacterium]
MDRKERLPRATPESQGVASSALVGFVDALDRLEHVHSVMVLRKGNVIAEGWWAPYRSGQRHALFSIGKSFTSTAIGLLVEEGRLSLEDVVADLLPDDAPGTVDDRLAGLRVRHLLSMSTGQARDGLEEAVGAGGWARRILDVPVTHEPGARFMYQTGATYLLAAIATRITGERLLDHLTPRLLAPLGIEGATWEQSPDGIDVGGFGLAMTTEDVAAFGQLLLERGCWNGRQLVPSGWIDTATATHVSNGDPAFPSDWTQGYGFQLWRGRHGTFRADGAFGQLCVVLPERKTVVVVTAGLPDMQAELDVLWDTLLPALANDGPIAPDPDGTARLRARLTSLRLPVPEGAPVSPRSGAIREQRYRIDGGGTVGLSIGAAGDRVELDLALPGLDARIVCGAGTWLQGGRASSDHIRTGTDRDPSPLAGAFAWKLDDWLEIRAWAVDTAIGWDIDLCFDGDRMDLELRQNVAFTKPPIIRATGTVEHAG